MPHIIGTAGHIDHGKTALVRALTGQETDRLKEEQERGISIDIGFAHLDLPDGERVAIIDVPGHERFIHNMLAGAHGVDLALLVVAADDGVMPQTEEHLDILHLLGITRGLVAMTKIDLVDAARLQAVREEIDILLAGTGLEGAPVLPVSAVTGAGLDRLRQTIEQLLTAHQRPQRSGPFRLPVDRAFVMRGHGIVVTGTAIAGIVRPGDVLRIVPDGAQARVRTVQVHGVEVPEATAGQRVALNLAGAERAALMRGHVVCDPLLDRVTDRCDVWVELRAAAARPVKSHQTVRAHIGTAAVLGKLVLLGGHDSLAPRQAAFAQLVLRTPVHALRGDRFILRNETAQRTIGGGHIVHPLARRHRRDEPELLARLTALRDARGAAEVARALLEIEPDFAVAAEDLAQACGLAPATLRDAVRESAEIRALPDPDTPSVYTTDGKWNRLRQAVVEGLGVHHEREPLALGMEMESLRSRIDADLPPKIFRTIVDALAAEQVLVRQESLLRLPRHRVALHGEGTEQAHRAEAVLTAGGFTPPDLRQMAEALEVTVARLQELLLQLERDGRVARIAPDLYFAREPLERARALLRSHVEAHGEIGAATFRDLLGASRKFSIALLDYFDRTGFTLRVGDVRKLRGRRSGA
jgi:selenocysteine-specific elongation factor